MELKRKGRRDRVTREKENYVEERNGEGGEKGEAVQKAG